MDDLNIRTVVARNLMHYRNELNISQHTLAIKSNTSKYTIFYIENCKTNATIDVLEKIANALGITVNDLTQQKQY